MRVLHIAGPGCESPWLLSRHERPLGLKSDVVATALKPGSALDVDIALGAAGEGSAAQIETRVRSALRAPFDYDVLHCHGGEGLFDWGDLDIGSPYRFLDIKLAKALGRRIVFTLHSSAHGLPDLADRVFVTDPRLVGAVAGAAFRPSSAVDVAAIQAAPPRAAGLARIGLIRADEAAVLDLENVHITPVADADIVIDDGADGWYGPLVVAALAMGKPVLMRLDEAGVAALPRDMAADLPIIPLGDDLGQGIAEAVRQRARWPDWSDRSRRFARRWHDPAAIAAAMAEAYAA